MACRSVHRFDLTHLSPTFGRNIDNERRVGSLRKIGIVLSPRNENREAGSVGVRDKPLMTIDHPFLAVLFSVCTNESGI